MGKLKNNQTGVAHLAAIVVIVLVLAVGGVGYYVWNSNKDKSNDSTTSSSNTTTSPEPKQEVTTKADPNAGYLVMKEWGLRFKVPSGLTDVKYAIHGDKAAFFAKPSGSSVKYISDYDKFEDDNFSHATGILIRSTSSTTDRVDGPVQGKKIGNYYYYTYWSFSGTATGAACVGLYGESDSDCQTEGKAFVLVNGNDGNSKALLKTIELAQ